MLSDSTVTPSDLMSPAVPTASALPNGISLNGTQHRSSNLKATTNDDSPAGNTAAPDAKVEKPRPHVCGTCGKGFHRLEHLKRHERSHTKEKPFECPECARCFARRDLLLRHQQKLHMTATPSSRPRSGRRESTSATAGGGPGRIRKNSLINGGMNASGPSSMRPRANTISHVDNTTLGTLIGDDVTVIRNGVGHLSGHGQLPGPGGHHYRGFSSGAGHHGLPSTLPKLDTHGFSNLEFSGGLRTAPPYGGFGLNDHDFNGMVFNPGSTINPQQLHFSDSPTSIALGNATSPFPPPFSNNVTAAQDFMDEDEDYSFRNALETRMSFPGADEQAVDNSSPSAISSTSQSGISEVMLDGSNNPAQNRTSTWQDSPLMLSGPPLTNHPYSMDMSGSIFPDMVPPPGPLSPDSLHDQHDLTDAFFSASSQLKPSSSIPLMPGYSGMDLEGGGGSMERTGTS